MKNKHVAFLGLLVALSMMLAFIESQIPPLVAIPGIKIGLPNIVVVFVLYKIGWKQAMGISLVRVILVSLLFGSVISLSYGLCGAILSLSGMIVLKKYTSFSTVSVSVVGGVLHNVGQIAVACFLTNTAELVYYLPMLLISGTIAGIAIGVISAILVNKFSKIKF